MEELVTAYPPWLLPGMATFFGAVLFCLGASWGYTQGYRDGQHNPHRGRRRT